MKLNLFERFRQHRNRARIQRDLNKRAVDFMAAANAVEEHSTRHEDDFSERTSRRNRTVQNSNQDYDSSMIYRSQPEESVTSNMNRSYHQRSTSHNIPLSPRRERTHHVRSTSSVSTNQRQDDISVRSCYTTIPKSPMPKSPRRSRPKMDRSISCNVAPVNLRNQVAPAIPEQSVAEQNPPPASAIAIKALPKRRIYPRIEKHLLVGKNCGVCLEGLADGDLNLAKMPCGHIFHNNCLDPWLHRTCTCPECRYEIQTNDAEYEIIRRSRMAKRPTVPCTCNGPKCVNSTCFFTCEPPKKETPSYLQTPGKSPKKVKRKKLTRSELKAIKGVFVLGKEEGNNSPVSTEKEFFDDFNSIFRDDETLAVQSVCL